MRNSSNPLPVLLLILGTFEVACGSSTGGTTTVGVGGTAATGGSGAMGGNGATSSVGGKAGIGGSSSSGGAQSQGGATSAGGATANGGATSAGGAPTTGGKATTTAGATAAGGAAAGGKATIGGATAAGGATTAGGTVAAGGKATAGGPSKGGASTTGGATAMGGTTVSGGTSGASGSSTTIAGRGNGCTPPAEYPNLFVSLSGHTQAESDAKVAAAWTKLFNPSGSGNIYFNGPGTDESYVKDIYNGDVRTEGMSYGMMTAVQLDHQTEFDRLWKWVRNHMAQNCTASGCTGEIAWSCSTSGGKNSTGGAPDGEEYMATALIFAHNRWGDSTGPGSINYAAEAQWVLNLIRTKYFNSTYHLVQFVANSGNVDGSYVLPAFYQVWSCFDTANSAFWDASVTAARNFFHNAIDSNGVIGDRSSFTGQTTQGAGADTIRCVVNIMMDYNFFKADPWQADTYAKKYGAYEKSQNRYAAQMSCDSLLGFGLPAADGKPFVDKLWSAAIPSGNYWDGTLYMLAMLHVSGTFKLWY